MRGLGVIAGDYARALTREAVVALGDFLDNAGEGVDLLVGAETAKVAG